MLLLWRGDNAATDDSSNTVWRRPTAQHVHIWWLYPSRMDATFVQFQFWSGGRLLLRTANSKQREPNRIVVTLRIVSRLYSHQSICHTRSMPCNWRWLDCLARRSTAAMPFINSFIHSTACNPFNRYRCAMHTGPAVTTVSSINRNWCCCFFFVREKMEK